MESSLPDKFTALSHPRRLDVFRLLMRRYPGKVSAGEVIAALALKPSTASVYLSALKSAGLITQTREGTTLFYQPDMAGIRGLFDGLLHECCQGRADLCQPELALSAPPLTVLFVCTGNSARSLMAEAILRRLAGTQFVAQSAGTSPAALPHPAVRDLLTAKGHDMALLTPKAIEQFRTDDASPPDLVITLCNHAANEDCPAWPNSPISTHWNLPDPAKAVDIPRACEQSYDLLARRIAEVVALPLDGVDRATVQRRLDDIGRTAAPLTEST